MMATDVLEILEWFDQHGIELCIDGGWAVDAVLGRQTRPHADLDIAVQHKDVAKIRAMLEAKGFREVPRDDSWECNFVLGDDRGCLIDLHSCTFDAAGNNVCGVAYPYDSLTGSGSIGGRRVRCVPPDWLVKFHTGYAVDENDHRDVKALCQHFGMELPPEYASFAREDPTWR